MYMGGVTTAFQSYDAAARPAILGAFSRRVWLGLTGFIPSLAAAAFAIAGKWLHSQCLVIVAIVFLGVAFVAITFAAIWTVLDIK